MNLRSAMARCVALIRPRTLDRELQDEILAHLEMAEQDAISAGLSPEQARAAARRSFGGIESMKDEHRDQRGVRWLENLTRDLRYGVASLTRDPGFAAVAVGLLALGIGANTAMFSILDATLLKPIPFPEPERMVRLWETPPNSLPNNTTTLTFLDWKRQDKVFEALSVERPVRVAVGTGDGVARIAGKLVSADYFQVFRAKAQIGRTFRPEEDQPGATPVVVLSHAFWRRQFGGEAGILNRDLVLDGERHRIVGILPPGSFDRAEAEFWKPLIFSHDELNRNQHWAKVVGRLRPGVSLERAQAEMNVLRASMAGVMAEYEKWGFGVEPFAQRLVGDSLRRSIYLVFGAVLMVLLIACANVANLVLAKAAARQKEMALRAALGASRGRLVSQLLTESLVLCLLGGAAGVALAHLALRAAAPLLATSLPFTADLTLDLRVLCSAGAAVILVLTLAGLLPALRLSLVRLSGSLNQAAWGSSGSSAAVRRAIVVAEVAVSVVLLSGSALLFRSLAKLQQVDAGVRIDHVITIVADLPPASYTTPQSAVRFYEAVADRLRAVPGVEQVALSLKAPLEGEGWGESISVPGVRGSFPHIGLKMVDPGYFNALQIPVLSGRGIESRDRPGSSPVIVINQEAARKLATTFNITNPVGRIVSIEVPGYGRVPESDTPVEIVGVIRSERTGELQRPQGPMAYMALAQAPQQEIKLVVRSATDPLAVMSGVREAMRQIDPNLPLGEVRTMEQVKERSMLWAKQPTWVVGAFAGVASLLAVLGLYGALSHAVAQQRREIGIRMAIGAGQGEVLGHVLRSACSMLFAGLTGGLAGAFALTRVLKSLLFNVSPLDPVALGVACLLMTLVGMIGAWIPARRATRVDPMTVLRDEG